jgi:YggT family protein
MWAARGPVKAGALVCRECSAAAAAGLARLLCGGYGCAQCRRGNDAIVGAFLVPVIEVIIYLIHIYWWIIIISAVMSWLIAFNVINTHSRPVAMIGDFLYRATEPALRPIRHFLPNLGGLDISPVILLLVLWFIERELIQLALVVSQY